MVYLIDIMYFIILDYLKMVFRFLEKNNPSINIPNTFLRCFKSFKIITTFYYFVNKDKK